MAGRQLIVMAVFMIMIQRILASCSPCWHGVGPYCGPTPNCSYGITWSCDCCYECRKGPGESCGGAWGHLGICGSGLVCKRLTCFDYNCWNEISACLDPEQGTSNLFWLGGSDISEEGQWEWTDGQPIEMNVYPWRYPEPNGDENENCLEWNGYWFNDASCNKQLRYICELDANEDATTEPTLTEVNTEKNEDAAITLPAFEIKYIQQQSGMIWHRFECRDVDYYNSSSSLSDCMNSCNINDRCTAVAYNNASSECKLYRCPIPTPQPSLSDPDWIAYSLMYIKVYDKDYCNSRGGILIGIRCLIISEEELNWGEASMACISKGGQLATLEGFRELELVQYFIKSMHENSPMITMTSTENDLVTESPTTMSTSPSPDFPRGSLIKFGEINF